MGSKLASRPMVAVSTVTSAAPRPARSLMPASIAVALVSPSVGSGSMLGLGIAHGGTGPSAG
jgi:hypothetical protein